MKLFDRLKDASRVAADIALSQPAVRRRVEALQQRARELRVTFEERFNEIESDLWAWIQRLEQEVRRAQRQQERARNAANHYRVLGLAPGASLDEIKTAYRRKMRECHPDRFAHDPNAEARAHARAQELNLAYAELTALLTGRESRRSA